MSQASVAPGSIVVLTHNGKMPAEGGKRVGYCIKKTDQVVIIGLPGLLPGSMFRPAKPKPKPQPIINLYNLDYATRRDTCTICGSTRTRRVEKTTNAGQRILVECLDCGGFLMPW